MDMTARCALLLILLLFAGCGSTLYDASGDRSAFREAAVSWVGAPLDDMIRAWGPPQETVMEAVPERNGLVRWRDTYSAGRPGQPVAGHRCIVEARYAVDRTILRVDTISHNCDDRYADMLGRLTRPRP